MMRLSAAIAVLCAGLASAATTTSIKPGAVTAHIAPHQTAPAGCSPNYSGTFQIGPVNVSSSSSSKRSLEQRDSNLGITLVNGVLTDPLGRTGYIASNQQFQFDGPPQAGAIWTAGFSICANGSLALGSDVIWWSCLSGTFYNLYFDKIGGQCIESYIQTYGVDGGHYEPPTGGASAAAGSTTAASLSTAASNATMSSSTLAASNSSSSAVMSHNSTMKFTTTKPPVMHTTTHGGSGSGASASAASSSTGSGNAAPTNAAVGAVMGVAGGLFAFAAML